MASDEFIMFNGDVKAAEKVLDDLWSVKPDSDEVEATLAGKEKQIVTEIVHTELTYLVQLELLIKFFLRPLSSCELIPKQAFDSIFSSVPQLYNINRELLTAIKKDPENISAAFITFAPYLKLYSIYAYGYKKALEILQELQKSDKKLSNFIKSQETRPEVKATLISLLIAPIQRVPRYRLLLQSLYEAASSQENGKYSTIEEALKSVEETADHINRLITEADEGELLIQLARRLGDRGSEIVVPGRKILKEGVVRKASKGVGSPKRYLVLFSDSLLICKGAAKGPLRVSSLLSLRHLMVEPTLGSTLIRITSQDTDMLVYTDTPAEGEEWINAIKDAVSRYAQCRRTLRKDSSKRSLRQRLAVRKRVAHTTAALLKRARHACRVGARKTGLARLKRLQRRRKTRKS